MAVQAPAAKLRDLLLASGLVDELQLRSAGARLEQWGGRLPRVLADLGMASEDAVAQVIAAALRLPVQLLGAVPRDAAALARLNADFCEEHAVFPVSLNGRTHTLLLAMADPTALDVVDLVAARANARVQVVVSTEAQIRAAVARLYRGLRPPNVTPPGVRPRRSVLPASASAQEIELDQGAPDPTPPPVAPAPSAHRLLDDLIGEDQQPGGFTLEELGRIEAAALTHARTTAILRALHELLREKGVLQEALPGWSPISQR